MTPISTWLRMGAALLFAITCNQQARAQLVAGNHFLQGNFIEVGIAPNGSFGSTIDAPVGYHPRTTSGSGLGFVADVAQDGWGVGAPNYHGDFFLPGTPQEGWSISSGTVEARAFRASPTTGAYGAFTGPLTGSNVSYDDSPTEINAVWEGTYGTDLDITQRTRVIKSKLYFTITVTLKNTGATAVPDVYYMRTLDADNDVTLHFDYTTKNKIEYAMPNPDNKVLVRAIDMVYSQAYLGLGTKDCRAKPFIFRSGLFPSHNIKQMYDLAPAASYYTTAGSIYNNDVGIALVYKIGDIAPGDSTVITYAYILNEADMEEALAQTAPTWAAGGEGQSQTDTLTLTTCSMPVTLPLEIENGGQYNWSWTATGAATLSPATGTATTVTINGPATIKAIGVGVCNSDTFSLLIVPPAVTPPPAVISPITYCQDDASTPLTATGTGILWYNVPVGGTGSSTPPTPSTALAGTFTWYASQTIDGCESPRSPIEVTVNPKAANTMTITTCSNNPYTYNGVTYTTSGSYTHHFTTVKGCDSAITLDLTVNPAYDNIAINATVCNGASYNFGGTPYTASGVYTHTFTSTWGCDSVVILTLNAASVPTTNIDIGICQGESYTWAGTTYNYNGTYSKTFTAVSGCDSISTLNLTVHPVFNTTIAATICEGRSYQFGGQEFAASGLYTVTYPTVNGCDSIITLNLTVTPAPLTTRKDTICEGAAFTIGDMSLTTTGNHLVRLKTPDGCDSLVDVQLYALSFPDMSFRLPQEGCVGEKQVVTMVKTNITDPNAYNWQFDRGKVLYGIGAGPYGIVWQDTGWHDVILERRNNFGCPTNPVKESIYIRPLPTAKILTAVEQWCAWDTVSLRAQWEPGYRYEWEPSGILTEKADGPLANMRIHGNRWYSVKVSDALCTASDSIYIETENCCTLELPTAFSPNGDGRNDIFRPIAKGNQQIAVFRVLNRWGQVVFESRDQYHGWDGTFNGIPQDIGSYMYYLKYKCADENYYEKQGNVTLLR